MNSVYDIMYVTIPAIAFFCSVFLLSTLLTAKKDAGVNTFMAMLGSFILWTGGSLFMRMGLEPGMAFWWKISLTGIFLVPYMLFLTTQYISERKGFFLKVIFGVLSFIVVVLNWFDLFLTSPVVETVGGQDQLHYSATTWAIIPVVLAAVILGTAWSMLVGGIKKNGMPMSYMSPFIIGTIAMIVGVFLDIVPFFNGLPMDTLGCAINAVFVYYAFYKKRVYSLNQITSNGAMYFITLMATAIGVAPLYRVGHSLLDKMHSINADTANMIITVAVAALAIIVFVVLNKLNAAIFVKEQNRKEDVVREFSARVNNSLEVDSIMSEFLNLVRTETTAEHVYLCRYDAENNRYESYNGDDTLEMPITILKSNPVLEQLEKVKGSLLFSDFKRSTLYRSMWEIEKYTFEYLNIELILPFRNDDEIIGFALLSGKVGKKAYTYEEVSFLESVSAITAIALKNAQLYSQLEKEAQLDAMTNLYNRRYFTNKLNETIEDKSMSPVSVILFNLDDFRLYNELYGTEEGDIMLQTFADILTSVFGSNGVIAKYGGKEFAVMLPTCDSATAESFAQRVKDQLRLHIESTKEATKKYVTFSASICTYPSVASNANELMTFNNLAIFHIKQHGKDKIEIYNKDFDYDDAQKSKNDNIYELTSTIYALTAAIDAKDHYTFNHSRCVSEYATKLAEFAGLPADYVDVVRQAGLLHDIGKIGIPDAILCKTGRLDNDEYATMKEHVERSIEMIRHLPSLDYVIPAVLGHHERYDGKGYPRGIAGEDIPIGARCLTVADSFDAMVSKRSYKDKMPVEKALNEILSNLGTQFDPELGKIFVEKVQSGEIEVIDY